MEGSFQSPASELNYAATNVNTGERVSGMRLVYSSSKSFTSKSLERLVTLNHGKFGSVTFGHVAIFLVKVAVLEVVRKLSKSKYPFIWSGLQALQVICYSPFKWTQRWVPFRILAKGMKMLSRPLLFLSVASAFTDEYQTNNGTPDGLDESHGLSNSEEVVGDNNDITSGQTLPDTGIHDEATRSLSSASWLRHLYTELENEEIDIPERIHDEATRSLSFASWLCHLYTELENEGIDIPERFSKEELHRFYTAANGDFTSFLLSVKKTIRWRETYKLLSAEELEMWSNLVFWHKTDVKQRPCLVVRLGLVCISLPANDRPRFAQAVVSQVEFGVLHLVDNKIPQITVLVDCEGLRSLGFPMQMMRSCSTLLQDNFPNRLGCLLVIRLPPVARVIAQTLIQVLKPVTRQKLNIIGGMYLKVLHEHLQTLPSYLGGVCACTTCAKLSIWSMQTPRINESSTSHQRNEDNASSESFRSPHPSTLNDGYINGDYDQILRRAIISVLMIWALIALLAGFADT